MDNKENNSNSEKLLKDVKTKEGPERIQLKALKTKAGTHVGLVHKCVKK